MPAVSTTDQSVEISNDRKRHGKHYTPTDLARFLARRILFNLGDLEQLERLRVLDPACGDGELLIAFHEELTARNLNTQVTLVGYDLDEAAISLARHRASSQGIRLELAQGDFLALSEAIPTGTFDAIITNPPYVRTQQLGQETAQLLASKFGLSGRIDLTHPFVTIAPRVLAPSGVLGILSSNRFLTTKSGANMRNVLLDSMTPVELYDLGDTKLFEAAVLPAVTIAVNGRTDAGECRFASAYEIAGEELATAHESIDLWEALESHSDAEVERNGRRIGVQSGVLVTGSSSAEPWRMNHHRTEDWLMSVRAATWKTFGDVASIRVGIKTTADSVFISDSWADCSPMPESALLLPLITHDNVTPWFVSPSDTDLRVLYPYDLDETQRVLLDMVRFPRAMEYLSQHEERLRSRRYVTEGGRQWFEIWVPQRPHMWASPKIVFPDISEEPRFALDRTKAVVNGDCYWISLEDVGSEDLAYLMLAVANSELAVQFYDAVCGNRLYSGRRRWITQYVSRFPIPDPSLPVSQRLIALVCDALRCGEQPSPETVHEINTLVQKAFAEPVPQGRIDEGGSSLASGEGFLF